MTHFDNTQTAREQNRVYHQALKHASLLKELEEQQECEFEQAFMDGVRSIQKERSKVANAAQFERESLATLSRKFELAAELLALESGCPTARGTLQQYLNELKHAIENKLKAVSTF